MTQERDRIGEIQDRLRRIETRLTKYMQERGFDTQVQKVAVEGTGDRSSRASTFDYETCSKPASSMRSEDDL